MNIRKPRGLSARVFDFLRGKLPGKKPRKVRGYIPDFYAGKMLFDVDIIGILL